MNNKLMNLIINKYHSLDRFKKILKVHLLSSNNKCIFLVFNGLDINIIHEGDNLPYEYITLLKIDINTLIDDIDYTYASKIISYY